MFSITQFWLQQKAKYSWEVYWKVSKRYLFLEGVEIRDNRNWPNSMVSSPHRFGILAGSWQSCCPFYCCPNKRWSMRGIVLSHNAKYCFGYHEHIYLFWIVTLFQALMFAAFDSMSMLHCNQVLCQGNNPVGKYVSIQQFISSLFAFQNLMFQKLSRSLFRHSLRDSLYFPDSFHSTILLWWGREGYCVFLIFHSVWNCQLKCYISGTSSWVFDVQNGSLRDSVSSLELFSRINNLTLEWTELQLTSSGGSLRFSHITSQLSKHKG